MTSLPSQWTRLDVPFVRQICDGACGAAALEMIYRYYGEPSVDQDAIFKTLREPEPHGSGYDRITATALANHAVAAGYSVFGVTINRLDAQSVLTVIDEFLAKNVPLIACQRYEPAQPLLGHFRVITGRNKSRIFAHDPCPRIGGADYAYSFDEFANAWKGSGENVTGGVAIEIVPGGPSVAISSYDNCSQGTI